MNVIVVEKSTGTVMSSSKPATKAIVEARKRKCALDDMAFVTGDVDIRIYESAITIVGEIKYLPRFLFEHGKGSDAVNAAKHRLDLWQQVVDSRVVDHPEKYSPSLADIFGHQLADEIMFAIDAIYHPDCEVYIPATWKNMEEAKKDGIDKAARTRRHLIMLVKHERLGVLIVGPSTLCSSYKGFKIERIFVREKK